jgi:hypothetical protein
MSECVFTHTYMHLREPVFDSLARTTPCSNVAEFVDFLPSVEESFNVHISTFPDQHLHRRQR